MNGILAILVVLLCVLGAAVVCLLVIAYDNKHTGSSRPAQRHHDADYAPVRDVYVVFQTTNNYTTHNDNRQVHIDANTMPLIAERQRALTTKPARKFKIVGGY